MGEGCDWVNVSRASEGLVKQGGPHLVLDDPVGKPLRVPLPSEHADQFANLGGFVGTTERPQPLTDELTSTLLLGIGVHTRQRLGSRLVRDPLTPQLVGQSPPTQPLEVMPRPNPHLGKGSVVNEPNLIETT